MTKFNVGDEVRLEKSVDDSSTYEDTGLFPREIRMLRGKELTVIEVERDGYTGLLDVLVVVATSPDDDHSAWLSSNAIKLIKAEPDPLHDPNEGGYVPIGHTTVDEALGSPAHSDGGVWLAPAGTPMPTAADINGPDSPWTKLGEILGDGVVVDIDDFAAALGIDSKGDPDVGPNEDSFYPGGKIYADASIGEVAKDEITFTVEQVVALLEAYKKAV